MSSAEGERRFEVEAQEWRGDASLTLSCTRCNTWTAILDSPADLDDLTRRADEHAEECR